MTGLNPNLSACSSAVHNVKGIVLLQSVARFKDSRLRCHHTGWSQYGWMGSITSDDSGNVYVPPIPLVNNLDHGVATLNSIYKIDSLSGEMNHYIMIIMKKSFMLRAAAATKKRV